MRAKFFGGWLNPLNWSSKSVPNKKSNTSSIGAGQSSTSLLSPDLFSIKPYTDVRTNIPVTVNSNIDSRQYSYDYSPNVIFKSPDSTISSKKQESQKNTPDISTPLDITPPSISPKIKIPNFLVIGLLAGGGILLLDTINKKRSEKK